jgi:phosphomannomutase
MEVSMHADRVEVSWDLEKSKWLVRIQAGEEVIRRYFEAPGSSDDEALRAAAQKEARAEGYEPNLAAITVER